MSIRTIDTHYAGEARVAAAYLVREGDEAAFVETNTAHAWPHLRAALDAEGLTPDAVRWIIVTHAHLDHAGGAWRAMEACPQATLVAHPRAAPHLIDPTKLVASARKVYGDDAFERLYGDIRPIDAARVRVTTDDERLRWGGRTLQFLHTRGHANHHHCVLDSASGGVFTGDAFGLCYPDLQGSGRWVFPSTSPTDFDGPAAIASVERLVATGANVAYLTHFGALHGLADAGASLVEQLAWATEAVAAADADGLDGDALDTHLRRALTDRFEAEIARRGLGDEARARVALDIDLNAQGLAFAVRKARFKRAR